MKTILPFNKIAGGYDNIFNSTFNTPEGLFEACFPTKPHTDMTRGFKIKGVDVVYLGANKQLKIFSMKGQVSFDKDFHFDHDENSTDYELIIQYQPELDITLIGFN